MSPGLDICIIMSMRRLDTHVFIVISFNLPQNTAVEVEGPFQIR